MPHKNYQRLREEARERREASLEGKPKVRRGRSRQRALPRPGFPRRDAREYRSQGGTDRKDRRHG